MKVFGYLFLWLSLFSVTTELSGQAMVEEGILDLRYEGFRETKVVRLNGEWEFYWNKHFKPTEFSQPEKPNPDVYGEIPSYWTDYLDRIPDITGEGIATYRMTILLPENFRNDLIFQVPVFDSSFRIYINGRLIGSNGVAGDKASESRPEYKPFSYHFIPQSDLIEIIINVSNFHHRKGGFWLPLSIGRPEEMISAKSRTDILMFSSIGVLFSFFAFFFFFFLIFRKDKAMLYFSLGTLGIMIRSMFTGSFPVLYFIDVNWIWIIRMEYIGTYLALIFFALYFNKLYPERLFNYISIIITVLFFIIILIVLLTPVMFFSNSIRIFYPIISVLLIYYCLRSFLGVIKKRINDIFMFLGFIALILASVNDMLHANSIIVFAPFYILSFSVIFLIMMQVIIIIYRWVHSYKEEKRLLSELEYVNQNLEKIVIDRTTELTNQKGEVEDKKDEIEHKNKELEKTIAVKNRIFSIIAHDMKSPVINLLLMADHLKRNRDKESIDNTIISLSQQAGFTSNLIDNLLLWGEAQQNRINYNAGLHNLTDIILENFNLMIETAERKNIRMTYSHKGDSYAICDKDLVNIIIRNLLSNAIKFTGIKGNISVNVEEPSVDEGLVYIKVKDNGTGITNEKLNKLKGGELIDSSPGTNKEKGTGLGLQLCFELVKINMGEMEIESEPGKGTTVIISLPSSSKK